MKKVVVLLLATIFVSCEKDRYCICSSPYADTGPFVIHGTRKDAKIKCTSYNEPNIELECKLK